MSRFWNIILLLFSTIVKLVNSEQSLSEYDAGLLRIRRCGFSPKRMLDVGANIGEWAKDMKRLWPNVYIFLIEGNSKHYDKLSSTGFPFEIALVGDRARKVEFYVPVRQFDERETGNSIYKENTDLFSPNSSVTIEMQTIDSIVRKHNNGPFDVVKFDIQGAEVNALRGAKEMIRHTEVVIAEAQIMNYNQGSPSFFKLHRIMDRYGFALYDIPIMRRGNNETLLQFDIIWIKKSSVLWQENCTGYPYPSDFLNDKPNYNIP